MNKRAKEGGKQRRGKWKGGEKGQNEGERRNKEDEWRT